MAVAGPGSVFVTALLRQHDGMRPPCCVLIEPDRQRRMASIVFTDERFGFYDFDQVPPAFLGVGDFADNEPVFSPADSSG